MHRLLFFIIICEISVVAISCAGKGSDKEGQAAESMPQAAVKASHGKQESVRRLLHNGMSDTIFEVMTRVYAARMDSGAVVKDGKPDYDREFSAFPNEDTCLYDTTGRVAAVCGMADGIHYKYEYGYDGRRLSDERYYQNGELFYDRKYVYGRGGHRVNTVEELYIAGSKTVNEYPVDTSKVRYVDGNRIEYGDMPGDYTVTDMRGNVVKESSYSEMDDYRSVIEYTYNDRGWRISINCDGEYLYTFDYTNIDAHGNWIRAVIRCNGSPYGIVEREIKYY